MKDIRYISTQELETFLLHEGEKKFRSKQIWEWIWEKDSRDFDEMSNLSSSLREKLKAHFSFNSARIADEVKSTDGTVKFIFELSDKEKIEGVLIPSRQRVTACISSQVGCPLGCLFCATGSMGFIRNLHYSEIIDQFVLMNRKADEYFQNRISNIVYMGMGEPLLNYENVLSSVDILTSPNGKKMSPSRITLSTVGIVKAIYQLADNGFKGGLAVSLHSADENIRRTLMPVARQNSLADLQKALQYYVKKTGQRITFEYIMLHEINDSLRDAEKLALYCKAFPVKINIIEYNSANGDFRGSEKDRVMPFIQYLESKNMIVHIRKSKGKDIFAACGQLVRRYK